MPITISSTLLQDDRSRRATNPDSFFHLLHSADVNFNVDLIHENQYDSIPIDDYGNKCIIRNASDSAISVSGLGNNDIVMWGGTSWEIYLDVSNPQTNNGLVFDKRTQKFYQYSPTTGWVAVINNKSTLDGGTY